MNLTKILHYYLMLLFLLTNALTGLAQSCCCLPDGITLSSQQEIDDFANQYPGCTEIEGELRIADNTISKLNGLSHLTTVGHLTILFCSITNLEGLHSLEMIHGRLRISYNDRLLSFEGMESLHYIAGSVNISDNEELLNFEGFPAIDSINGHFTIEDNERLKNLTGLSSLTNIEGHFVIENNFRLINMTGLSSLKNVNGGFTIFENLNLISLHGLANLKNVNKHFLIESNRDLINLEGLSSLQFIKGEFIIRNNDNLKNLNGLISLESIAINLIITLNKNLNQIGLFDALAFIGSNIEISNNDKLTDLSGLACFNFIGTESLIINNNRDLESLESIEHLNLNYLSQLVITSNYLLQTCAVQSICEYIENGHDIILENNFSYECNNPIDLSNACQDLPISEFTCEGIPFPNPTSDYLMLNCKCDLPYNILYRILDTAGQLMSAGKFNNQFINVSSLPAGTYFIKLEDANSIDLSFTFVKM